MTTPFDSVAWAYDAFMRRTKMYRDDLILQVLDLKGDERVADLGGGTGHYAELISPLCREVVVVDASEKMLEHVPRLPNVTTLHADLAGTGLPDDHFDAALMLDVIHHVGEQKRSIEEAYRILRSGGRLVMLDFDASYLKTRMLALFERVFLPPVRYWTAEGMASLMAEQGFADMTIQKQGWQYLITGRKA